MRSGHSRILKPCRKAALLAVPLLAGCATHELELAPSSPDKPWTIPDSVDVPASGSAVPIPIKEPNASTPELAKQARDASLARLPEENGVSIDQGRHYDLAALIDLAQRKNPETREAWEKARQAALGVGLAETAYVPQLSAEAIGGFQHTPLPIPSTLVPQGFFISDTRELIPSLTAKWLLFDFGQRAGAEETARANSFVANVAFTGAHQKLIYAVCRDYFSLGAARGRLRVAQQALKTADVVQGAAESKQSEGLATVVEVAQARRQTAQARFNLEKAIGAEHNAYAALIASLGVAPSTHIQTKDSSELKLPANPSGNVDQFVQTALANRPDIIAAFGKVRAAEGTLKSARGAYFPTVGLEGQIYQNMGALSADGSPYFPINKPGGNILLKLSVPLYDGGARDAHVALAESDIFAARAALDQSRDTATRQVTDAYDALHTSYAEYVAALALTEAAQTSYDAALDAYRHGVGTYTALATEETALSQAQSAKEDAHANVFTAAAALAFATGAILSSGH